MSTVVQTLFPEHQERTIDEIGHGDDYVPFTISEINEAVTRFKARNKAPGPDGISARIIGTVHKCDHEVLRNT